MTRIAACWILAALLLAPPVFVFCESPSSIDLSKVEDGNSDIFLPENMDQMPDSPLAGKRILFLGSSVTVGFAAKQNSFVDYLHRIDKLDGIKEAVSGTTLADLGPRSYLSRLKDNIKKDLVLDGFVCQLSTNDASFNVPIGEISTSKDPGGFNTKTTTGAIEAIVSYVQTTWHCPIIFFTSPPYASDHYGLLVKRLGELQNKWGFSVIDLWNDRRFNSLPGENRKIFMHDSIHPTMAGYLLWWLPKWEEELPRFLR